MSRETKATQTNLLIQYIKIKQPVVNCKVFFFV